MIDKKNVSTVIADDHPMILKGLYDELTANNYNVVGQATNGMKALELILTHNPTIALLDIDMPLLTGFEVIKWPSKKKWTPSLSFYPSTKKMNISLKPRHYK